jgi:hypothetical protein
MMGNVHVSLCYSMDHECLLEQLSFYLLVVCLASYRRGMGTRK